MNSFLNKKIGFLKYQDIIALICFIATFILLCWRSPFGYVRDEDFYLSIPFRLIMGDSLLTEEWHVSQLSGFLLYLPVKVYFYFAGSTEGIILFFRYLFVIMQGTVSFIIYRALREYGIFSIIAMLIYFLHLPNSVMALSYNTMGLSFVLLTGLMLFVTKKFSKFRFYITGLFVACAVLCNPVLAIVYFLFTICMIVYEVAKKNDHKLFGFSEVSFSVKTWLWITLGIASVAAIFFFFLFSRTSMKEIIDNFPMLFTDPEYQLSYKADRQNIFTIKSSIFDIISISPYLFGIFSLLMVAIVSDKKRITHRPFYLSAASIVFLVYILCLTLPSKNFHYSPLENIIYWMFPLTLLGLACYLLSEYKDQLAFAFLWLLGILYAVCLDISSDLGPMLSTLGLAVSNIAAVIFMKNIIDELLKQKQDKMKNKYKENRKNVIKKEFLSKLLISILAVSLMFQIGLELYFDLNISLSSFENMYERPEAKLNAVLETGPLKGIKTTAYRAEIYNKTLSDLSKIKSAGKGNVFILPDRPWCYLYLGMPYAAYSAYTGYFYAGQSRLAQYYVLHPERTPQNVYVSKYDTRTYAYNPKAAAEITAYISDQYNCTVEESSVGYILRIAK